MELRVSNTTTKTFTAMSQAISFGLVFRKLALPWATQLRFQWEMEPVSGMMLDAMGKLRAFFVNSVSSL